MGDIAMEWPAKFCPPKIKKKNDDATPKESFYVTKEYTFGPLIRTKVLCSTVRYYLFSAFGVLKKYICSKTLPTIQ
jgi:hypothetical protein